MNTTPHPSNPSQSFEEKITPKTTALGSPSGLEALLPLLAGGGASARDAALKMLAESNPALSQILPLISMLGSAPATIGTPASKPQKFEFVKIEDYYKNK